MCLFALCHFSEKANHPNFYIIYVEDFSPLPLDPASLGGPMDLPVPYYQNLVNLDPLEGLSVLNAGKQLGIHININRLLTVVFF